MDKDSKLIMEALQSKFLEDKPVTKYIVQTIEKMINHLEQLSKQIHLSRSSEVDQLLSRLRDTSEMLMSERGSGTSENEENSEKDYPSQKLGSEDAEDIIQHCYVIDKNDYRLIPINLKKAQQIKSNKNEYSSFKRSMGGFAMEFEETKLLICLSKKFPYFYIDLNDLTMHKPGAEDASELKAHVKQNNWDIVSTSAGTVYNAEEALLVDFSN
jgi:hypothetical protein